MKTNLFGLITGITLLASCVNYETYIPPYEFRISENFVNVIEKGHIIYYDSKPIGSLDAVGILATAGRGPGGIANELIADTTNIYFQQAAKKYKNKIFPLLPEK